MTQSIVDRVLDDVVAALRSGRSVLLQAALQGHGDVLTCLLRRVNNSYYLPPSSPNSPELVQTLAEAFLEAAELGHSSCLTSILECGPPLLDIDDLMNATRDPAVLASRDAKVPQQSGGQEEAAKRVGKTALMLAAQHGHAECVKQLLEHTRTTQVAATNKFGDTALILAAAGGHAECVNQLLQQIPEIQVTAANMHGNTALILAADRGHAECVEQLLQHSPETQVAAADEDGLTALITAAARGHAGCAKQLLEHLPEAQVAAASKFGCTALILAAAEGHVECVQQLLQHTPGPQVAAGNMAGSTALMRAAAGGHAECVRQLLEHFPETQVAATNNCRDSALTTAVRLNSTECVPLLLAHCPASQVASRDGNGKNLLKLAAHLGRPQCLELLLVHDTKQRHLDAAWLAALRQWDAADASISPHSQCLEQLLVKGALLPSTAGKEARAKNRMFLQDFGSKALVPDRVDEAMVGSSPGVSSYIRTAAFLRQAQGRLA